MEIIAPLVLALLFVVFGLSNRGTQSMRCDGCTGTGECQASGECQEK